MLFEQGQRGHHVAFGLTHLLAIGVEHPARDQRVLKGQAVVLEVAAYDRGEEPRANDLVGLEAKVHGKDVLEELGAPAPGDLGGERTRGPGVHDVGVTHEALGLEALGLLVASGHVARGVDGQLVQRRHQRLVEVGLAARVKGVPHRQGHPEEALA